MNTESPLETRAPQPRRRPLRRRITFLFVALFFGLLIGGLGAEVIFRFYLWRNFSTEIDRGPGPSPQDPAQKVYFHALMYPTKNRRMSYRMKPNVNCTVIIENSWLEHPVQSESHGFRSKELTKAKPEKTFRILGLGDSTMWGYGLLYEDCYMGVFEEALRRGFGPEWRFEIMNTGLPGYNTVIENEIFKELGLDWGWDLVLQQYDLNDSATPGFLQKPRNFKRLDHLYLLDLPGYIFGEWWSPKRFIDRSLIEAGYGHAPEGGNGPRLNKPGEVDAVNQDLTGWENLTEAYKEIVGRCREGKVPLLVFMIHNSFGEGQAEADRDPAFDPIKKLLDGLQTPWMDVFPYHRKHALENGLVTQDYWIMPNKDYHPNLLRSSIIALALYERLQPLIAEKTGVNVGIDPEQDTGRQWLIERIRLQTEDQKKKPRLETTAPTY